MTVQAGMRKTLQSNWIDVGLYARADVFDNSSGTPTLLSQLDMSEYLPGMYQTSLIPTAGVSYLVAMRVYTDGTYTTLDANYAPASEDFECVDLKRKLPVISATVAAGQVPNVVAIITD